MFANVLQLQLLPLLNQLLLRSLELHQARRYLLFLLKTLLQGVRQRLRVFLMAQHFTPHLLPRFQFLLREVNSHIGIKEINELGESGHLDYL